ncbi:MAG TPA: 4-(cytidine 5'-diphospho)-2-C-methyl-D-erythritol kinase [Gammaproteobacteria bacterium]|nr:4-(cytidine 5'-diphospho)-2-C-methyl-D-erythritol kinase [Gammaproteobacteria bacterium]
MNAPAFSHDWPAPAKLNLFLHITGRRADGYHTLQTVFQFLDHGDRLDFALRDDGRITRVQGPDGVAAEHDLVVRAAHRLREAAGFGRAGADIRLHKRLPIEAGLGGGSSDAATTLVALNRLWNAGLSLAQLAALGLELGADVPVFVHGQAAWAEGVGEVLSPLNGLPEAWFLVLQPACRVSTRALFQAPELTRNSLPITIAGFRAGECRNDFEPVVRRRYPEAAAALDWFAERGRRGRLTGSGACVFAAFDRETEARAEQAALPPGWQAFVARGCNRSPLRRRLEQLEHADSIGA